jgi:transposase, IS5 family
LGNASAIFRGAPQALQAGSATALNGLIPFESFRAEIEAVVRLAPEERKSKAGRKPFDAVMMFKVLVLHTLYNLADEQVEYQIRDRLSFMRFLGLGLEDTVPDATTVWLVREALAKAGLFKTLFGRFNRRLDAKGYIARQQHTLAGARSRRTRVWRSRHNVCSIETH